MSRKLPLEWVKIKFLFASQYWSFRAIGFFNEADTLESSSILIYFFNKQSIYTPKLAQSHIN